MKSFGFVALLVGFVVALSTSADARKRHARPSAPDCTITDRNPCSSPTGPFGFTVKTVRHGKLGPRPRAWCGYEMRRLTGHYDPALNLARNWLRKFPRVAAPGPGDVVVWARGRRGGHVARIVRTVDRCTAVIQQGNPGGVFTRNICNALGVVRV